MKVIDGTLQRFERIGLARANGRHPHPRAERMQDVFEMFCLIRCRAGYIDVAKLCVPVKRDFEIDIHQSFGFVRLNLRLHLGFEESVALQKFDERISGLLDVD